MPRLLAQLGEILTRRQQCGLAALVGMSAIASLADSLGIMLVFLLVTLISDSRSVVEPGWLAWLHHTSGVTDRRQFALLFGVSAFVLFMLKNAYAALLYYLQCEFCQRGAADFSTRLYRGYVQAPFATHARRHSADLVRNTRELGNHVYREALMALLAIGVEVMVLAGITMVLLALQPLATMVAGTIVVVAFLIQERLLGRRSEKLGRQYLQLSGALQKSMQEGLDGLKETKILGREDHVVATFATIQTRFSRVVGRQLFLSQLHRYTNEAMVMAGVLAVVVLVVVLGHDTVGVLPPLALFAAATFRMVPAVNRIMYGLNALRHYGPSVDVALQEIRGFEAPGCARRPDEGPGHPVAFEKEIRLTAVSYQYPSRERPAVRDVTVTIRRGTCVGVVGESGAGKSTLADLLLGLLVPTSGQVLVDGVDIATDTQAWQRNLGYVPRDVYVADETIRRNVALGLSDLEIDDERVWEALRLANLDEFVTSLPGGIETSLGERGVRLSDGQRQRVGIARALYHNPVVVVFDEATAALDVTTEHEVTRAIRNLKGHKTLVVIAHRLSTVTVCDQLLLMRSGNLIDVGTFGELAERNPDFSRAVDLADLSPWATRRS